MAEWSSVSRPKERIESTDVDRESILYIHTMVEYIQCIHQGGESIFYWVVYQYYNVELILHTFVEWVICID